MLKYQDEYGNEIEFDKSKENEIDYDLYHLFAQIQEMGDIVNLAGKFRMQYGTQDIIGRIKGLQTEIHELHILIKEN